MRTKSLERGPKVIRAGLCVTENSGNWEHSCRERSSLLQLLLSSGSGLKAGMGAGMDGPLIRFHAIPCAIVVHSVCFVSEQTMKWQ